MTAVLSILSVALFSFHLFAQAECPSVNQPIVQKESPQPYRPINDQLKELPEETQASFTFKNVKYGGDTGYLNYFSIDDLKGKDVMTGSHTWTETSNTYSRPYVTIKATVYFSDDRSPVKTCETFFKRYAEASDTLWTGTEVMGYLPLHFYWKEMRKITQKQHDLLFQLITHEEIIITPSDQEKTDKKTPIRIRLGWP